MTKPGIHRCTADSKRGRQVMAETGRFERGPGLTQEQQEHNARVEAERQARLERRRNRREEANRGKS